MKNLKDSLYCIGLGIRDRQNNSGNFGGGQHQLLLSQAFPNNSRESGQSNRTIAENQFGCFHAGVLTKQIQLFHAQWKDLEQPRPFHDVKILISPQTEQKNRQLKVRSLAIKEEEPI